MIPDDFPDLPTFVAGLDSDQRRRWNRERVLVDDDRHEGHATHDDAGNVTGWEVPIRTQHVVPQPPPPDHPAAREMMLAPARSPLLVARSMDEALRSTRG